MNELGPDSRALLDAARDAHDIDPATRARLRSDMLRRVGAGAVVATTVAAASKSSAAPVTSFVTKLVVVAALATGGVLFARHAVKSKPAPAVVAPQATIVTPAAPTAPPQEVASPPPAMAVVEDPAAAPVAAPETPKPVVAAVKPKAAPAPASTLEDELRALREAHVALRDGRPSDALSIVDGMKGSSLGPERAATRSLALCALGRADARASAEKFLATYPSSPLAPRVRTACSIPSE